MSKSEEDESHRPIIVKRVKKIKKAGHHGGSWKIAYADFVTAMMAFFLLMWLLGLLNKYQLAGVSEYFRKPLKEAFSHESKSNPDMTNNRYTEKEKEKEKAKEKPNKVSEQPTVANEYKKIADKKTEEQKLQMEKAMQMAQAIKEDLEKKIDKNPQLREYKNLLNFQVTADGLKIILHDIEGKPMFSKGQADFEKYAHQIVGLLGEELNNYPNRLMIIGHTDANQYNRLNYSNWELSADRANATRRALVDAGLKSEKIARIVGLSDTQPLNKKDGKDPANRRIEIIVLTDEALRKIH